VLVAEQRADHQEPVVVALNLLVGLVVRGVQPTGLLGLRSKAETVGNGVVLVVVVSLAGVAVQTPLAILVVVVALGLPGEPLLLPIKALGQHPL